MSMNRQRWWRDYSRIPGLYVRCEESGCRRVHEKAKRRYVSRDFVSLSLELMSREGWRPPRGYLTQAELAAAARLGERLRATVAKYRT